MRNLGWGLIGVFGGGILYLLGMWVYQVGTGYYVEGEATTALIILGMVAALALIPAAIGVRLVRTHPVVPRDRSDDQRTDSTSGPTVQAG